MRGHVDTESLALYAAGLLSRGEHARIHDHLSGCPECRAVVQQLAAVSTELSQVPAAPLPPGIADRLDLALSTEIARRAAGRSAEPAASATSAESAGSPSRTGSPMGAGGPGQRPPRGPVHDSQAPGRPTRRRWAPRSPAARRLLGAAAGIAVVLAGAGYGLAQLATSTSSGSGASSAAAPARSPSRQALKPFYNGPVAAPRIITSGTNYQRGTLGHQAAQMLAAKRPGAAIGGVPGKSGGASRGPAVTPATNTLLTCAAAVSGRRRVVLIDQARYAGQRAYVIILAPGGTTGRYTAVVIGPGCSATRHPRPIARAQLPGG